ncbi:hypothetical protein ACFSCW_01395 [Sphingomonas tabacisoli]|uniref:Uncharacterized protein n=1 Tax=Sphingomonas tabacisoli TaxID=2249466 RepID=A0ABW4HXX0_9SPHN
MREFASFSSATQRYIRRSLGIVREPDAVERYSRDPVERVTLSAQARCYERIPEIRERVPEHSGLDAVEPFMAPLVGISAFDLAQDRLTSFSAYRFLYERLIGAAARPWLLGAFCAASSMPHILPARRRDLFLTITESTATAPGWSRREPSFYPEWIDLGADDAEADPSS